MLVKFDDNTYTKICSSGLNPNISYKYTLYNIPINYKGSLYGSISIGTKSKKIDIDIPDEIINILGSMYFKGNLMSFD